MCFYSISVIFLYSITLKVMQQVLYDQNQCVLGGDIGFGFVDAVDSHQHTNYEKRIGSILYVVNTQRTVVVMMMMMIDETALVVMTMRTMNRPL
jgi:hypothetical protein